MTKNITIWIFSVLFLLITCVGINDFCHTMTYNEAYIGSHFGAGGYDVCGQIVKGVYKTKEVGHFN